MGRRSPCERADFLREGHTRGGCIPKLQEMDKNLEFHGLPEYWRKILGVEKTKSHEEFKSTSRNNKKLAPQKATKRILKIVKTKDTLIVSSPIAAEHEFHVEVDPLSNTGFKGLPPDIEHLLL